MNTLFNDQEINIYLDKINILDVQRESISYWKNELKEDNLVEEVANYTPFENTFLVDILGYDNKNDILRDNKEIEGSGRSEFKLKINDEIFMIIELKGSKVDLDNSRNDKNETPVDQLFRYARKNEGVPWLLLSNYNEFRLYNYYKPGKYISWTVNELFENENKFKEFILLLGKNSFKKGIVNRINKKSLVIEENFNKEFYKLFAETRLMIIRDLEQQNENLDRISAIHYAQLILDRIIFICFAEDKKLLPPQILEKTIQRPIKDRDIREDRIFEKLRHLFEDIDYGNKAKKIPEYNGGLFNERLGFLKIQDLIDNPEEYYKNCFTQWKFDKEEQVMKNIIGTYYTNLNPIYKNFITMAVFNFNTEVDVNILGHIFEHSINDIEKLKEDNKKTKQKFGIYYTPPEITEFICKNTIISYLSKNNNSQIPELLSEYSNSLDELDEKLKTIKIIDPACGSGAFLNKSVDVLIEIHEAIWNLKNINKKDNLDMYVFDTIEKRREIILNNIYGVDLNEESIEITKLALFLKICKEDKKLPNLDTNIKCGNSLTQDETIVGNKLFVWHEEFKEVFEQGGFDIVIGNPPYGAKISKKEQDYLKKHYVENSSETTMAFIKLSYEHLLKNDGNFGFIIPKSFLYASNYSLIRKDVLNDIIEIVDCGKVWSEVKLEQIILMIKKNVKSDSYVTSLKDKNDNFIVIDSINKKTYDEFGILLNRVTEDEIKIARKIKKSTKKSMNDFSTNIRGISLKTKDYIPNGEYKVIGGKQIQKEGIIGVKGLLNPSNDELIKKGLIMNNSILVQNIVAHILKPIDHIKIIATIPSNKEYLLNDTVNQIHFNNEKDMYVFWSYLQSKLINWYCYKFIYCRSIRTMHFDNTVTVKIPVKINDEICTEIETLSRQLYETINYVTAERSKFKKWLVNVFNIEITSKLENYELLDFKSFITTMINLNNTCKSKNNYELLFEEFENNINLLKPKIEIINKLDNEINNAIYKLYDLNNDEIRIIEEEF